MIPLFLGVSLAFRSWVGLIAAFVVFGVLLYRIRDEEELLHKEFGREWEVYCQTSARLIPKIF